MAGASGGTASSATLDPVVAGVVGRGLLIGEARIADPTGGAHAHHNGFTGRWQFDIPLAGATEVDLAVAAARASLPSWRATPYTERQRLLHRLADLLEESTAEFGTLMAVETGIPTAHAPRLVGAAAGWLRYYAGWIDKIDGQVLPLLNGGLDYTLLEPYGVIAVIPPFNGPITAMGMKVAPALAAGNTVVIKPSELSPLVVVRFGELALEAGFPPGVVNVIPGGAPAGEALVAHRGVDKITFTGGGGTATAILRAAAETMTPVTLELGGKSANIVFPDADLDAVVPTSLDRSVLFSSGQICLAPTRLLVHRSVVEELLPRLEPYVQSCPAGDPLDPATQRGPMISDGHMRRVLDIIERAKTEGDGRILFGGTKAGGPLSDGYFIEPTVFAEVDPGSRLAREEVFGPVLSVLTFETEAEAIALANDSPFGLAAYVHTNDLRCAHRVAAQLQAGYVNVNGFAGLAPNLPFGGYKQSGYGREGGRAGLDEFLQTKNIYIGA